jgi:hypothetical protein
MQQLKKRITYFTLSRMIVKTKLGDKLLIGILTIYLDCASFVKQTKKYIENYETKFNYCNFSFNADFM